jgi:phage-related protein
MANSFGGSIKLTGENEYRKALSSITSDLKLMSSEMKVMQTSTDKGADADKKMQTQKEALQKSIEKQKQNLADLSAQLAKSASETGTTSNQTKALQTQVNNATAKLNQMESGLKSLDGGIKGTGDSMDDTGKKASIFGDVLKANLASDLIMGGLSKIADGVKALGSAFGGLVKDSIGSFAEYEQLVGGVETLFKDSADVVQKNASEAYKTAGVSANKYMELSTSFSASLLQSLGGDTAKASQYADMAIKDMADNANKMGTDLGNIQNAYQGFAKQNYTMLDNLKLGYGGTKTEMERLLKDAEKLPQAMGKKFDISNYNDVIEAIHLTQDNMGILGTTAKEASETISGSLQATQSAWENVQASFGTGDDDMIKQAIDGLVESFGNLANNVVTILPNVLQGIVQLVQGIVSQLPAMIQTLLPTLLTAVQGLISSLTQVMPALISVVMQLLNQLVMTILQNLPMILQAGIDILLGLIDGLVEAIPQLIPVVIQVIMQLVNTLIQNLPTIIMAGVDLLVALVQGIVDAIPELIKMLPTLITTIVTTLTKPDMIVKLVKGALDIVIGIAGGIVKAIPEIVKVLPQIISSIVSGLGDAVGKMAEVGSNLVKGIWNGISNVAGWIMDKIKGFGKGILDGIKGFFGIHSPSTMFRDQIGKNLALGVGEGFEDNMAEVTKEMQDALPTSFDTDVSLNTPALSGQVADEVSFANMTAGDTLVDALQTALKSVKIELDDKPLGNFVVNTVERAIY